MKIENRGGKRIGAGRPKSPYKRKIVSFNIRVEFEPIVRKLVIETINNLKNQKNEI